MCTDNHESLKGCMIIRRKDNEKIAAELNLTLRSVENYLSRIYGKTGCRGHEELIKKFG